ncbi:MAG TPA: hypothetical protein VMS32_03705 [Verrucomicrobiae bacterium]|nr:hypothetical protein [Verrucomicrobiae bacterium]
MRRSALGKKHFEVCECPIIRNNLVDQMRKKRICRIQEWLNQAVDALTFGSLAPMRGGEFVGFPNNASSQ